MQRVNRRVVVTGLGLVTCLGSTVKQTWNGLIQGQCGITDVDLFDLTGFAARRAGQIPSGFLSSVSEPDGSIPSRLDRIALMAFDEARADADLDSLTDRTGGLVFGGGSGAFVPVENRLIFNTSSRDSAGDHSDSSPYDPSSPAVCIKMRFPWLSSSMVPMTACSSAAVAIGFAYDAVRCGDWDYAVAGGADVLSRLCFGGFNTLRAMDPDPCKPFDRRRIGMSLGEGAGVLILESLETAQRRGVPIHAEMRGYGLTGDAFHMTTPDASGRSWARCLSAALQSAHVSPDRVQYLNAHGTGTPLNDSAETAAVKLAWGQHANQLAISSTKSMIGHCQFSAGAVEAVITILAITHNMLPPTIHLDEPDPVCDLDYVPNVARECSIDVAGSSSFGFGGSSITLLFQRYPR